MKSPAYHLRPNKAAERFALIEAIRRLTKLGSNLEEYTYYGLGGPYLEDCRLLYEFYPEIPMVSIEEKEEVVKRQIFHLPCDNLHLEHNDMKSFINQYESNDKKGIFWLDYTRLEYSCFDEFKVLLGKIAEKSIIKVTLRAESDDFWDEYKKPRSEKIEKFQSEFMLILPDPSTIPPRDSGELAYLMQEMLQIAAQQTLPAEAAALVFQPVSSFYYSDGTGMFTLTGIVCKRSQKWRVNRAFQGWEFANLTWKKPTLIDIPILSTKERLHLQHCLPCYGARGKKLHAELGYLIDDDSQMTDNALEQYAAFHRYFPYFVRGTP
jgi:hypothetical protein